ncbi:uncharacterized protein LOC106153065 [Lingula anatina]|uniref:Uncharacterized protein LOC106153065 n=1 Tax=Lingula anatina TaxID=7574 RepID=A0A1S3H846_LINAN|nr:uncharacterized protein LOC106153065 [Lingula anatina]XP_013382291.1 uncharacterized protein LOC106153065 [Lingula anatina]|eukprot:XP_013382290.1 uncharacterized protein LOC106153065 [Lingula anatina]
MTEKLGWTLLFLAIAVAAVTGVSYKKGLGFGWQDLKCRDFTPFVGKLAWWYDWRVSGKDQCTTDDSLEYVPMLWNLAHVPMITNIRGNKYLLGFNEPNFRAQSNISPELAAEKWVQLQKNVPANVKMVSPAAAPCDTNDKSTCNMQFSTWFTRFFARCNQLGGCRIDYVATHHYTCNAYDLLGFLGAVYNQVKKPLWVTEFSCPWTRYDATPIKNFMRAAIPMLEKSSFIYRYAWFAHRLQSCLGSFLCPTISLIDTNGQLTELGRLYLSL